MRIRQGPLPGSTTDDITRGVVRLMSDLGHAPLLEFRLTNKRRVDVAALDRDGKFVVIEVKSPRRHSLATCHIFYRCGSIIVGQR